MWNYKLGGLILLYSISSWSENSLLDDDLLFDDEFEIEDTSAEPSEKDAWWKTIVTDLSHTQSVSDAETYVSRTKLRAVYDAPLTESIYLVWDNKITAFWGDDQFSEENRFTHDYKLQKLSLQYSRGQCAYTLGRQNIIWGEVDGTFAVDIVTPFDYTEQLLTDYSAIRLAQDAFVTDCFLPGQQIQFFYVPEAKLNRTDLDDSNKNIHTGDEWGVKYKYSGEGFDISLMQASLYSNTELPVFTMNENPPGVNFSTESTQFNFTGVSGSVALGRLLIKIDTGYRNRQRFPASANTTFVERADWALGIEYTTASTHQLNAGIWQQRFFGDVQLINLTNFTLTEDTASRADAFFYTAGWSKAYVNDTLTLSLLAYYADNPELTSVTFNSTYQWNDYWSFSLALGASESEALPVESPGNNTLVPADGFVSFEARVQF